MKEIENGKLELDAEDIERVVLAAGIQFQTMRTNVRYKGVRDDIEVKQGEGTTLEVTPHTGDNGVSLSKVLDYIHYDLKVKGATRVRGETQSETNAKIPNPARRKRFRPIRSDNRPTNGPSSPRDSENAPMMMPIASPLAENVST